MSKIIKTPAGVTEYLPKDFEKFRKLQNAVEKCYQSFGFLPLQTSIMQYLQTLAGSGEINKEIYGIARAKAENNSSEDNRGLRFDLTKPLARYVAEFQNDLVFPFKRAETGLVYRGERPQKGRERQFFQADFDVVGREKLSLEYDALVINLVGEIFEKLGLKAIIRVNHREILRFLLKSAGIKDENLTQTLILIDKLEKVGTKKTIEDLVENTKINVENAHTLVNFLSKKIELENVDEFLKRLNLPTKTLQEVEQIFEILENKNGVKIVLDLSIARGLDYYTGTVFETNLVGLEKYGSVCSGGRYENLVSQFSNNSFPGVGGSIGLSRLFTILKNENLDLKIWSEGVEKIFLAIADEKKYKETHNLAKKLREKGEIVHVATKDMKFKKQFEYASKLEVDQVWILEENQMISQKNMKTGKQILTKADF